MKWEFSKSTKAGQFVGVKKMIMEANYKEGSFMGTWKLKFQRPERVPYHYLSLLVYLLSAGHHCGMCLIPP